MDPASRSDVVEHAGLRDGAREAVEQEAAGRVRLGEPVADHLDGDVVGDQVAAVHVGLGLHAPAAVPLLTLARKMSPVEILGTPACSAMNWACVPLPAPGGPDQDEAHYRRKPS